MYTAIISFALGLIAGALIALNNKAKSQEVADKGKSLLDKLKGR